MVFDTPLFFANSTSQRAIWVQGGMCTVGGVDAYTQFIQTLSGSTTMARGLFELTRVDGTGPFVQYSTAEAKNTTLNTFAKEGNATLLVFSNSAAKPTLESGYTGTSFDNGALYGIAALNPAPDTSPSVTLAPSFDPMILAIELNALRSDSTQFIPPTAASTTGSGTGTWSNTGNILAVDGVYATSVTSTTSTADNNRLVASGFGFDLPSTSEPVTLTAQVRGSSTGAGTSKIAEVVLLDGTTVLATVTPNTALSTSDTTYEIPLSGYGISYSTVSSPSFGVGLRTTPNLDTISSGYIQAATLSQSAATNQWTNIANVTSDGPFGGGGVYAYMTPAETATENAYLVTTAYPLSVPSTATITRVQLAVAQYYGGGTDGGVVEDDVRLVYGGAPLGTNQASATLTSTNNWYYKGGAPSAFGATLTPAIVNDPSFGVQLRYRSTGATSSTAYTYGGTASQTTGTLTWSNLTNAQGSTASTYATLTFPGSNSLTVSKAALVLTNFGFSIPANATITGVRAQIRRGIRNTGTGTCNDESVYLVVGGTQVGVSQTVGTNYTASGATGSYGSTTSLWGLSSLTPSQVNASDFGLAFKPKATTNANSRTVNVDWASISITYTTPGNRDVRVDEVYMLLEYTNPVSDTVKIDSVKLKLEASNMVFPVSTISTSEGVSPVVVSRQRNLSTSISEALTVTGELSLGQTIKYLQATISLAEALTASAGRNRAAQTTIGETSALSTEVSRARALLSSILETGTISAAARRDLKLLASVTEQEAVLSVASRLRQVLSSITEAEVIIAAVGRLSKVSAAIAELSGVSAGANRTRLVATSITELEQVVSTISRARTASSSIAEVEVLSSALTRARAIAATLVEQELVTAGVTRLVSAAATIAELEALYGTAKRQRGLGSVLNEQETATATAGRARTVAGSVLETETISALLTRARALQAVVVEHETVTATSERARQLVSVITELETIEAVAAKFKALFASIVQAESVLGVAKRTRAVTANVEEVEVVIAAVKRTLGVFSFIHETQTLTAEPKRVRSLVSEILQHESLTAAVTRVRGVMAAIAAVLNVSASARILIADPKTLSVTCTWEEWEEDEPGVLNLVTHTQSWTVRLATENQDLALRIGETITLSVEDVANTVIDLSDVLSSEVQV